MQSTPKWKVVAGVVFDVALCLNLDYNICLRFKKKTILKTNFIVLNREKTVFINPVMSEVDPSLLRRMNVSLVYISTIRHLFVFPFGKL